MLPMTHDYCNKELPNEYQVNNMFNITHLFDGNDIITATIRKNDNLRRRMRSEKAHESHFTTSMGLAFEHTGAVGARAVKNK